MISNNKLNINLKKNSTTLLTLYVLTASLYVAVFNSLSVQMLILTLIILLLVAHILLTKSTLLINKIDILFLLSIFALIFSLHNNALITANIAGPVIFALLIVMSILMRGEIENFSSSIKLIKWGGIFYAVSVFLNYLSPSIYEKVFLDLLRSSVADNIRTSISSGYYTGFTGQVAYTAGYIVFAIGIVFISLMLRKNTVSNKKVTSYFALIILIIGLLLTQKRAHLIFMILSLMIIFIAYSQTNIEKVKKTIKVIIGLLIALFLAVLLSNYTGIGQVLFARIIDSFNDIAEGQDITSNRINLWIHAWNVFLQNPLFGIGWGNFDDSIIGTVTVNTKMDTHNVYLQLLSETGIVGALLILLPLFLVYMYTLKIVRNIKSQKEPKKHQMLIIYSFYIQTFTLLYCFTGNVLYDYTFLSMYLLSIGMASSYWQCTLKSNKNKLKLEDNQGSK